MARRLIGHYRALGVESVAVFSEADADAGWLDAADFDTYLNGRLVERTYLDPMRVVGAAVDAGCDAIHPGCSALAEDTALYDQAIGANVGVIGTSPECLAAVADRPRLRRRASELQIPVAPGSEVLPEGTDGIEAAATVQLPVWVRRVWGRGARRVAAFDDLAAALAAIDGPVYLEGAVPQPRSIAAWLVGDRNGGLAPLGCTEAVAPGIVVASPAVDPTLVADGLKLGRDLGWVGIGCVRWAVAADGRSFLVDLLPRPLSAFGVVEAVHDIDLIETQHRVVAEGQALRWAGGGPASVVGIEAALAVEAGACGVLEDLELPAGAAVGPDRGAAVGPDTDPILARITVVAPDLPRARAQLSAALATVRIAGVATNLDALRRWAMS